MRNTLTTTFHTTIRVSKNTRRQLALLKEAWDLRTLGEVVERIIRDKRPEMVGAFFEKPSSLGQENHNDV